MINLLPSALDIISVILILLLVATGLMVIFGLMGVINMAHGEFFLIGAYGVYYFIQIGLPFYIAVPLSSLGVGLLGLLIEAILIRHLIHRPLDTILATWGLSIVLKQLVVIFFGPGSVSVDLPIDGMIEFGPISYPFYRIIVMLFSIIIMLFIIVLYRYSKFGLAIRATIEDPKVASSLGINNNTLHKISFFIGASLAGLAGALIAPLISVDPQMGLGYLVPSFLSILVGGVWNITGTVVGVLFIGGLDGLANLFISPVFSQILVFTLAIIIIRFRPKGIFGGRG